MAQGDVFIDGDGKIGIDATGKIRLVDASSDCPDCCGSCTRTTGTNCSNFADGGVGNKAVLEYDITFSGITLCDCGDDGSSEQFKATSTTTPLNAKFRVTLGGISCFWGNGLASETAEIKRYTTTGCTTVSNTYNVSMQLYLKYNSTPKEWEIILYTTSIGLDSSRGWLFHGTVAANLDGGGDPLGGTVPAISDDNTGKCFDVKSYSIPGSDGGYVLGYGGSATVVCV